ncbi:MAG TPA: hypothetical protein VKH46_08435 [Thermoanaerobaculia bacterium]|nr:hypothetical protein [Thermoanaerobaculia bacterium]
MSFLLHTAGILAAIAVSACAARFAADAFLAGLSRAERWAWALWLGLALEASVYLVFLAAGRAPGPAVMVGAPAVIAAAAILFLRRRPRATEPAPGSPARALLALSVVAVAVFALAALSEPMWSNDFLAIWGFKGKTIWFSRAVPDRIFHDPAVVWSHPEYPLFLPAVFAALSASIGRWDDHALAALFPLLQAATAAALYGWTKRRFSTCAGALAAILAAAFFPLFRAFEVGMAEIPLALSLLLFSQAAVDFDETPSRSAGMRLAIASLLAAAVKREGTLFVVLAAGWMALRALRRRNGRAVPVLALAAAPAVLHGLLLTAARGSIPDRDYDWSFARPDRWPALAGQAGQVLSHLFRAGDAATWIAFLALAFFAAAARPAGGAPALAILGPALLLQSCVYVAVCSFSTFDPVWQASFVPRLENALFPVMVLAVAPRLAFLFSSGRVTAE